MAIHGQAKIPEDTMRETKLSFRYDENPTVEGLMIGSITTTQDNVIKLPYIYEERCSLQYIRIKCKGNFKGDQVYISSNLVLPIFVSTTCSMELLGSDGVEKEKIVLNQTGMTGEIIKFQLDVVKPTITQTVQLRSDSINITNTLKPEFKMSTAPYSSETVDNPNTRSPERLTSNVTISNPVIPTQLTNGSLLLNQSTTTEPVTNVKEPKITATTIMESAKTSESIKSATINRESEKEKRNDFSNDKFKSKL
eukprot:XP_016656335.1 PREDICTED: uncharacterized protein LOC107882476 [Acyrthosiphon pisum]